MELTRPEFKPGDLDLNWVGVENPNTLFSLPLFDQLLGLGSWHDGAAIRRQRRRRQGQDWKDPNLAELSRDVGVEGLAAELLGLQDLLLTAVAGDGDPSGGGDDEEIR